MPGQRLPMRKLRDVLRLRAGGMSKRQIAASLSIWRNGGIGLTDGHPSFVLQTPSPAHRARAR